MRLLGAPRRRQDDRQRGADAELHAYLVRHLEHAEHFEQHRHDHGAAADPEQAGKDPGDDPGGNDGRRKLGQFGDWDRAQRFGLATIWVRKVPIAGERMSTVSPALR
jgi:hypothetical protein